MTAVPIIIDIEIINKKQAAAIRKQLKEGGFVKTDTGWGRGQFWTRWQKGDQIVFVNGSQSSPIADSYRDEYWVTASLWSELKKWSLS